MLYCTKSVLLHCKHKKGKTEQCNFYAIPCLHFFVKTILFVLLFLPGEALSSHFINQGKSADINQNFHKQQKSESLFSLPERDSTINKIEKLNSSLFFSFYRASTDSFRSNNISGINYTMMDHVKKLLSNSTIRRTQAFSTGKYRIQQRGEGFSNTLLQNQKSHLYYQRNYPTSTRLYSAMPDATDAKTTLETKANEGDANVKTETPSIVDESIVSQVEVPSLQKPKEEHSLYENLVRRLYMTNLFNPVKLGLENTIKLHEVLGSPMNNPDITIIHIAGTNGKGSVALKTAKTFQNAGHTTGLFVSPHISSFRERMSVNGVPITEDEVEKLLPRVFAACEEHSIPATFFEITTILAFLFYAERNVDVAVLETGLGGRLDATNIIQHPALTIITSIGLEHTRILGDTIEKIAMEKGGIIKRGAPVLVGPETPYDVLRQCAIDKGASSFQTCDDVLGKDNVSSNDETCTDYDELNSRMVRAAIKIMEERQRNSSNTINKENQPSWKNFYPISEKHLQQGVSIRPPCRFEIVSVPVNKHGNIVNSGTDAGDEKMVTVILDVAHNPPAMNHLVSKLNDTFPNKTRRFVAGFSSDKDLQLCAKPLIESCDGDVKRIHLIEAAHPRAATLEAIQNDVPELRNGACWDAEDRSITAQLGHAVKLASINDEILVVCGSVFIMAEAREALGFTEPRDSVYISEVAGANLRHAQENFGSNNPLTIKK